MTSTRMTGYEIGLLLRCYQEVADQWPAASQDWKIDIAARRAMKMAQHNHAAVYRTDAEIWERMRARLHGGSAPERAYERPARGR